MAMVKNFILAVMLLVFFGTAFASSDVIDSTFDFDSGVKVNTTTITDRYNISDGTLEVDFPYAEKDPALVSYWRFEGDADDELGVNNGTVNGATYTADGKFGGAYDYDGETSYIAVPDSDSLHMQNFTISLWMKPAVNMTNEGSTRNFFILDKMGGGTSGYALTYYKGSGYGNFYYKLGDGSSQNSVYFRYDFYAGEWYHIVYTYDHQYRRIYINGVEVHNKATTFDPSYDSKNLVFGRRTEQANYWFNGTIDEVKIYNRSLSADEIKRLYNDGLQYVSSSATWEKNLTVPDGFSLHETTVNFSASAGGYIEKIQWLVNGSVKAEYNDSVSSGSSITIQEENLTSGSFSDVEGDFSLKVFLKSNGSETPIIQSITVTYFGIPVHVHVESDAGFSIKDAHVTVSDENGSVVGDGYTDEDGNVSFYVPFIGNYTVTAQKTGYAENSTDVSVTEEVYMTLTMKALEDWVYVHVYNYSGEPYEGVNVYLYYSANGSQANQSVTNASGIAGFFQRIDYYDVVISDPVHGWTTQKIKNIRPPYDLYYTELKANVFDYNGMTAYWSAVYAFESGGVRSYSGNTENLGYAIFPVEYGVPGSPIYYDIHASRADAVSQTIHSQVFINGTPNVFNLTLGTAPAVTQNTTFTCYDNFTLLKNTTYSDGESDLEYIPCSYGCRQGACVNPVGVSARGSLLTLVIIGGIITLWLTEKIFKQKTVKKALQVTQLLFVSLIALAWGVVLEQSGLHGMSDVALKIFYALFSLFIFVLVIFIVELVLMPLINLWKRKREGEIL